MSIFSTAIKTLSDIAIQESSVELPTETKSSLVEEVQEMLDDIPSLNESEMVFDVRAVPVVANPRFNKYLIEMEDISRYMITNKISSITEAIGNILECNGLEGEFNHVALVIDESSILSEMEDLGICCCDNKDYPENTDFNKVGRTSFGTQDNMKYIRRLANTKQLLDTLYNNYGIPYIKKNYNQVGLLKEEAQYAEDVELQKKDKEKVLHEKDVKNPYSEIAVPNNMNPSSSNPTTSTTTNTSNKVSPNFSSSSNSTPTTTSTTSTSSTNTTVGPNFPSSKAIPKPSTTTIVGPGSNSVSTTTSNTNNRVGPNFPTSKVLPKPNTTNPLNKPMTESNEDDLQYLRDVAAGKYDEF